MPGAETFEQIVQQQGEALTQALISQAKNSRVTLPAELARRIGTAVLTGGAANKDFVTLRDLFHERPPLTLVAFDTPGVHDYVFRVRRPVDLAGGSHLVAAFTHQSAREAGICSVYEILSQSGLPAGVLIFAGGGKGLAIVPTHRAADLRFAIEAVLANKTHGDLKTVTAELSVWPEDLGPAPAGVATGTRAATRYAAAVSVLMARLARERSHGERFGETVEPTARRCAACRRRPGTKERSAAGEWICDSCVVRRDLGGKLKRSVDEAKTFEQLVSDEDHRLAVLYADGANVGVAFQQIDSMARHRALSSAVEAAFDVAVEKVREGLRDEEERLLCQVPIRGGDDAIVILPARKALGAARTLVRAVESAFDLNGNALLRDAFCAAPKDLRRGVERFGVGVGIVFADRHFPVGFLVHYAEELLRSAKGLVHGGTATSGSIRSAVDYLVLESGNPLSESIERLRDAHFRVEPRGREPGLRLTERPFSTDALERVIRDAEALRKVEPSQLFALRQELLRGFALSRNFWRYQHARAKDDSGWTLYRKAYGVGLAEVDQLLWRDAVPAGGADPWKSTSVLDALEILDLIPVSATVGRDE